MASIKPWISKLVESELKQVITWKGIKTDPAANARDTTSRFSDDGSNFRTVLGSPPLDSASTIQLLEKPGANARAKIPVSDGEVSVLAVLSDAAWKAYDKAIEEDGGDEPRKGDLLLCRRLTIVSTVYGPSEERVKLRIEDLELAGNVRKVIGQPKSLLQKPAITKLCESIGAIRRRQQDADVMDEEADEGEDEDDDEEVVVKQEEKDDENDLHGEDTHQYGAESSSGIAAETPAHNFLPAVRDRPAPNREQATLDPQTSPALARPIPTALQVESQLPTEALRTQVAQHTRTPVRRNRGGYAGVEQTRGDNLTGPQAPTLHQRQPRSPVELPRDKLLGVFSKMPAHIPRKRSPEPSAPISAQVVNDEMVLDTPAKAKSSPMVSSAPNPTPVQHKRCRVPRDQRVLLDNSSSWIPSAPGSEFPHPNVPIEILKAWNDKVASTIKKSSTQPSPIALVEHTQGARSVQEVQLGHASHISVSDGSSTSEDSGEEHSEDDEDEPLEWSQTPRKSQALPPDSSANQSPTRIAAPASQSRTSSRNQDTAWLPSNSQRGVNSSNVHGSPGIPRWKMSEASRSSADIVRRDAANTPTNNRSHRKRQHSVSRSLSQQATPARPSQVARDSPTVPSKGVTHTPKLSISDEDDPAWLPPDKPETQYPLASQPALNHRNSPAVPASLAQSYVSPAISQAQHYQLPSTTPARGANARPVTHRMSATVPNASQPTSAGPRNPQPLTDTYHGAARPSTQQPLPDRRRSEHSMSGFSPPGARSSPVSAPTAPRAIRGSQNEATGGRDSNCRSRHEITDRRDPSYRSGDRRPPSGDLYRPAPSRRLNDSRSSATKHASQRHPAASQAPPNGTNASEMETAVPRALPLEDEYRGNRRVYMRDQQRRNWLETIGLPKHQNDAVSIQSLVQRYRERYSLDPVTEHDFAKLVHELRPNAITMERPVPKPAAPMSEQRTPMTSKALSEQAQSPNNSNDHPQLASAGITKAPPANLTSSSRVQNDAFVEFATGWKAIRPGGAFAISQEEHRNASSGRTLNVLGWGFG